MSALVRPLTAGDDLAAVSRIYAEGWRTAYRGIVPQGYLDRLADKSWMPALADRTGNSLVVELEGRLVGTASFAPARDRRRPGWGEVISLYLLPEVRGRGLGAALLREALARLAAMGYRDVYLWVLEENGPARRFYERQGLICTGERTECVIEGKTLYEVRYVRRGV